VTAGAKGLAALLPAATVSSGQRRHVVNTICSLLRAYTELSFLLFCFEGRTLLSVSASRRKVFVFSLKEVLFVEVATHPSKTCEIVIQINL